MTLKGIGYTSAALTKAQSDAGELPNVDRILSVNPKWWYNWGSDRKTGTPDVIPQEFVPMLYSDNAAKVAAWPSAIAYEKALVPKTITAVLGFNEPDHPLQSNMTALEALNGWKPLQDNGFGLLKGSPAAVGTTTEWMDQFMGAQKALDQTKQSWERDFEVNFVACHIYQGPVVSSFFNKVDALHTLFGKDVWVTETCVHDNAATTMAENQYSRAQVEQYMRDIWAGAQSRTWLKRIAWHTRSSTDPQGWSGSLFNADGSLTSTGIVWRDLDKLTNP